MTRPNPFYIWLVVMLILCLIRIENPPAEYTEPIKQWNDHDSTAAPTWSDPDNLKQIRKRYER